jgi:hypothetical protein
MIANQRQTQRRHVNPDLVCSARFQNTTHQGAMGILIQHPKMGQGQFARIFRQINNGHAQPIGRVAADGQVH